MRPRIIACVGGTAVLLTGVVAVQRGLHGQTSPPVRPPGQLKAAAPDLEPPPVLPPTLEPRIDVGPDLPAPPAPSAPPAFAPDPVWRAPSATRVPAPAAIPQGNDPVEMVDTFIREGQDRATASIKALTEERDALRARLAKVEAALGRWQGVSRALNAAPQTDVPNLEAISPEGTPTRFQRRNEPLLEEIPSIPPGPQRNEPLLEEIPSIPPGPR